MRNLLRDISVSPAKTSRAPDTVPRLFQSPALLSDAVRRLGLAATDRVLKPVDPKRAEDGDNILRIMTNLLTFSQQKIRRDSESSKPLDDIPASYSLLPTRRSTVFIANTTHFAGADKKVAVEYIFQSDTLAAVCETNSLIAKEHGRYDHERVFRTLGSLFPTPKPGDNMDSVPSFVPSGPNSLFYQVISRLWVQHLLTISLLTS